MADALCGPSNALQSFKRHTQVDRSLQQDRLAGPRTPAQSFRTQDPRAGSLDAEFHAFENAPANPFPQPLMANHFVPPAQLQNSASLDWANDFQQLSLSDQPLPAQQFRNYAPLVRTTNGGWHNEFMKQQQQQHEPMTVAQGKQVALDQQHMSAYNPAMQFQGGFAPMSTFGGPMGMHQIPGGSQMEATDQIADADWSQAFEEAFQGAFEDVEQKEQMQSVQNSSILHEDGIYTNDHSVDIQDVEQIRIGSDAIDYTELKDRTADQEKQDASALARVAGELLHNVQNDSSEKFQNSQFLNLMRKIRDRQVEVRNNDFEVTANGVNDGDKTQHTASLTDQHIRTTADPAQNQDTFTFPDMNTIYSPREVDAVDYSFDSDQFPSQPRNQISDLHPGGKRYPEQSPPGTYAQMSGAVPVNLSLNDDRETLSQPISAADFEAAYDESRGLASKYHRPSA